MAGGNQPRTLVVRRAGGKGADLAERIRCESNTANWVVTPIVASV
jgi:hypothetical protein